MVEIQSHLEPKKAVFLLFKLPGVPGVCTPGAIRVTLKFLRPGQYLQKTRPDTVNPFWVMFRVVKLLYNTYAV